MTRRHPRRDRYARARQRNAVGDLHVSEKLATFRTLDDQQDRLRLTPDPSLEAARRLFGLAVYVSSQISITESFGNQNDTSDIIVADMSQVIVGFRTQTSVLYDPYTYASQGQVQVISTSRVAFNVLAAEGVEIVEGMRNQ
jgi:HK97 family phage major capsid protein